MNQAVLLFLGSATSTVVALLYWNLFYATTSVTRRFSLVSNENNLYWSSKLRKISVRSLNVLMGRFPSQYATLNKLTHH